MHSPAAPYPHPTPQMGAGDGQSHSQATSASHNNSCQEEEGQVTPEHHCPGQGRQVTREIGFLCSKYKDSMALKVFLIASLQLLTVLGVKTQKDLLAAFREEYSIPYEI